MRIVQVGMGGWGRDWAARVLPKLTRVVLAGCVDQAPSMLALAQQQGIVAPENCYGSLAAALASTDADAVLVTTDLAGHAPAVKEALGAGKHVLVEKPFAPSLAAAQELVALAEARGRTLMVSQNYRFFPAVRAARAIVDRGELGSLHAVHVDFRRFSAKGPEGATVHQRLAQPLLSDMAIHQFDLVRAVIGREPLEVFCQSWNPPWSWFAGPAEAVALISFDRGPVVSYRGSWLSSGSVTPWAGEWRMGFERGEVWWTSRGDAADGVDGEQLIVRPRGRSEHTLTLSNAEPVDRVGSLTEFLSAVETGRMPETSGQDNVKSLALMHAAIASAAAHRPVPLSEVTEPR